MRLLFLGDIVGRAARKAVIEEVPVLRQELGCDAIVVNCENAAGGFGVTPTICDALFEAGVDVLTSGNHIWDKAEISPYLQQQPRLLRPANMAREFPGSGVITHTLPNGQRLAVINVMANLFMADNDNMFACLDKILEALSWDEMLTPSWWMCMAKQHLKKWQQVIFVTAASHSLLALIRIFQPLICVSCRKVQPIRQMPVCAAIINLSSGWNQRLP